MVPGSTLRYGSSLRKRTLYPRACKSAPSAADARPFPREETTPPVMKINRAMGGQHGETAPIAQAQKQKNLACPQVAKARGILAPEQERRRDACGQHVRTRDELRGQKARALLRLRHRRTGRHDRSRSLGLGRRPLAGRHRRIENRFLVAAMKRQEIEAHAGEEKQDRQNGGGAGERVGRPARTEQAAKAAATSAADSQ